MTNKLNTGPDKSAATDHLLTRLEQRILTSHGGQADGWKHHWNLTEDDSLMHKEAAERIRQLEARVDALATTAPPDSWKAYVTVAEGEMLKPSRRVPDGTYALIDRNAWDQQVAPVQNLEPMK